MALDKYLADEFVRGCIEAFTDFIIEEEIFIRPGMLYQYCDGVLFITAKFLPGYAAIFHLKVSDKHPVFSGISDKPMIADIKVYAANLN